MGGLNVETILLRIPALLLAITVHECAHGLVAYKLGDPTAKNSGRLTLNPIAHMDPLGTILMIIAGFGWAKPVPVNAFYFKNKKRGMSLVSIAGPLSNILFAFITAMVYGLLLKFGFYNPDSIISMFLMNFLMVLLAINVGLAVFNMLPIPPLDGSKILNSILPDRIYYKILQYERFALPLLFILMFLGILTPVITLMMRYVINSIIFVVNLIL